MKKAIIILTLIAISAILAVIEAKTVGLPSLEDKLVIVSTTVALSIVVFVVVCHLSLGHKAKRVFMSFFNGIIVVCFAIFAGQMVRFLPGIIDSIPENDNALLLVAVFLGMLYLPVIYGVSFYLYINHLCEFDIKKMMDNK